MNRNNINSCLNQIYNSLSNDIVVLYGSRYVGIRTFVFDFVKNKNSFYYKALSFDFKMQISNIVSDLSEKVDYRAHNIQDLSLLIKEFSKNGNDKKVIIIDDFNYIYHENSTLINFLLSIIREECNPGSMMIILTCSNPDFINNDFMKNAQASIFELSGILEINELSITDVMDKYKIYDLNEILTIYSVIGGSEYFWDFIDLKKDFSSKDFIINEVINKQGRIFYFFDKILPDELREKTVYNTLLFCLANGYEKLSELYDKTGYDRAKISVYLKNLSKFGIVSKSEGLSCIDDAAIKKGHYKINNCFVRFFYRFMFSNISKIIYMSDEKFYKKYIESYMNTYKEESYMEYCIEKISNDNSLGLNKLKLGYLNDKANAVDFAGTDDEGHLFLFATRLTVPHMSYSRLEKILDFCKKYKVNFDYIYLISAVEFDQKLSLYSSVHKEVKLLRLN